MDNPRDKHIIFHVDVMGPLIHFFYMFVREYMEKIIIILINNKYG